MKIHVKKTNKLFSKNGKSRLVSESTDGPLSLQKQTVPKRSVISFKEKRKNPISKEKLKLAINDMALDSNLKRPRDVQNSHSEGHYGDAAGIKSNSNGIQLKSRKMKAQLKPKKHTTKVSKQNEQEENKVKHLLKSKNKFVPITTDKEIKSSQIKESKLNIKPKKSKKSDKPESKSTKTFTNLKALHMTSTSIDGNLDVKKVSAVVSGVLKHVAKTSQERCELLDLETPVFMEVECIKIPVFSTKQLRFQLPHPLVGEMSDVLLITPDKKGAKINPEKAVEYYTELLERHGVSFINKVVPLRQLRQEYSQFEMRRKLVDQFDMILVDAGIAKSLPKILGKFIMFKRKMPIAVHLDRKDLKKHLELALSKTQMTVRNNTILSSVQVGHTKMSADKITANVVEVAKVLPKIYPGGWSNIRCLGLKTFKSPLMVVYISLVSPNDVKTPMKEQGRKREKIEEELSTQPGMNVVVLPSGKVYLKRDLKQEKMEMNVSVDEEILKEAAAYRQSTQTVTYSDEESSNDENDEDDEVTEAMEQKLLNKYKRAADMRRDNKDENEDKEEEDSSSDEDLPVVPPIGKKRKAEPIKKQSKTGIQKTQQKGNSSQQKAKDKNQGPTKDKNQGPISMPKRRGVRAGKKNKISKDQRKASIKRKKAGKA